MEYLNLSSLLIMFVSILLVLFFFVYRYNKHCNDIILSKENNQSSYNELHNHLTSLLLEQQQKINEQQLNGLKIFTESLNNGIGEVRTQVLSTLNSSISEINYRVDNLTEITNKKLYEMTNHIGQCLTNNLEKTSVTFTDIVKRLALIDEAQKKITELSDNIIDLQKILSDKKARGAFGETQLSALIQNMIPSKNFALQYTLSNNKRVDCIIFLPYPTGNIAVDAKFPLENYQKLSNQQLDNKEKNLIKQQFRIDIKKHIQDIAEKYIIPGETADGAIMFIPAESIFAEIHNNYPEIIESSYKHRVWLASPTTLMAILTTARAVIKDFSTRQQINTIQEHLVLLSKDFLRFQDRLDNLNKHISQANSDVEDIIRSSKKICQRFDIIEKVELAEKVIITKGAK